MKLRQVGEVGVDSGHIVVAEPAVASLIGYTDWYTGRQMFKQMEWGVSCVSGHGDGDYPVYAVYDDKGGYMGILVWFYEDMPPPFEVERR